MSSQDERVFKRRYQQICTASVECWGCKRAVFISQPCCFGIDHVFCTVQIDLKELLVFVPDTTLHVVQCSFSFHGD